jgi:hypothetical protein
VTVDSPVNIQKTTGNFPGKSGKPFREITLENALGNRSFPDRKTPWEIGVSLTGKRPGKSEFLPDRKTSWEIRFSLNRKTPWEIGEFPKRGNWTLYWTTEQTGTERTQNQPSNRPSCNSRIARNDVLFYCKFPLLALNLLGDYELFTFPLPVIGTSLL